MGCLVSKSLTSFDGLLVVALAFLLSCVDTTGVTIALFRRLALVDLLHFGKARAHFCHCAIELEAVCQRRIELGLGL